MLLDPSKEVKRVYNIRNLSITPKDSLFESVEWAVVKDDVLYFSVCTVTAPEKNAQGNYLVAVDINTDKTLWMSKPRTVNSSNFLIVDNSIICGLGGSGIPDYIYVLNRYTGVKTREYWIPTAATWFAIGEDKNLYVTLYDKHVAFKITK
jgi:outer membrane protein assembly factor BamB